MWTAEGRPPTATASASGDDDQAVDGPPAHNRARSNIDQPERSGGTGENPESLAP